MGARLAPAYPWVLGVHMTREVMQDAAGMCEVVVLVVWLCGPERCVRVRVRGC